MAPPSPSPAPDQLATSPPAAVEIASPWAPLRRRLFLALFVAQLASNVGTWMQNVGAQVLMSSLDRSPLAASLVQTAGFLPVLFLALPAGVLGDVLDRRRLLIVTQIIMLAAAATLGFLTVAGSMTPALLLVLTLALGVGTALMLPAWQAIQPELVPRSELGQAAALNGASVNLARAVGPAVAGLLVALAGPAAVFFLNGASFVCVAGALAVWRPEPVPGERERIGPALRSGVRYVAHAPRLGRVLVRTAVFVAGASAVWGLLPIIAFNHLHLGSAGYGGLLGCLGLGALVGSAGLPRLRRRLSLDGVVTASSLVFGATSLALALTASLPVIAVALFAGGIAWVSAFASLNATAYAIMPAWVRSRALAAYVLVFYGGQAVATAGWGVVAQRTTTSAALVAAGLTLFVGFGARRRFLLSEPDDVDPRPSRHWPEPEVVLQPGDYPGHVMVVVDHRVPPDNAVAFVGAMQRVGRARRRTGARQWALYRDAADQERFVETYVVDSWDDHLRQHHERTTESDRSDEDAASALTVDGRKRHTQHLLPMAPSGRDRRRGRRDGH